MIVFGTRGSRLATAQTHLVARAVQAFTGESYRLEIIETRGDRIVDVPLPEIGGKGLFTAELEEALRAGRIDAAVHSLKDLPTESPKGLTIGAIPARVDPRDVLVYDPRWHDPEGGSVPLLGGAVIGTSSWRRRSALLNLRRDLTMVDLRGNVPTRVDKVRQGRIAAAVLAAAGLERLQLDMTGVLCVPLPPERCTPAPGQGALAVQCREDDARLRRALAAIHDADAARCVEAERRLLAALGGGCSMPLGALATLESGQARLLASLYSMRQAHPAGVFLDLRGSGLEQLVDAAAATLRPLVGEPLAGKRLLLLRPGGEGGELGAALTVAGAELHTLALTEIEPIATEPGILADLPRPLVVAFTSPRAVDQFFELAAGADLPLEGMRFYAGGEASADAVRRRGVPCDSPSTGSGGRALALLLLAQTRETVLFPCALEHRPELETELQRAGRAVLPLPLYRTVATAGVQLPDGAFDFVLFTSPSAARAYRELVPSRALGEATLRSLALGPTTAAAMHQLGLAVAGTCASPDAAALVNLIQELPP